jgi:hypothetical protein
MEDIYVLNPFMHPFMTSLILSQSRSGLQHNVHRNDFFWRDHQWHEPSEYSRIRMCLFDRYRFGRTVARSSFRRKCPLEFRFRFKYFIPSRFDHGPLSLIAPCILPTSFRASASNGQLDGAAHNQWLGSLPRICRDTTL